MAKYTGAVRFPDGELRFFVWSGTVSIARPKLFVTSDAAFDAWDDDQTDTPRHEQHPSNESVDVMPYYCHGSEEISFASTANRHLELITGALSLDEATQLSDWK